MGKTSDNVVEPASGSGTTEYTVATHWDGTAHHQKTGAEFIDEDGALYGVKQDGNRPIVISVSHGDAISEGLSGHYPVRRFGHNAAVGGAWETVYHGSDLYTYLTSAERLYVISDDTDDDGAPVGNGARTVVVKGLDASYEVLQETVTMNGTTHVLTDASFLRVTKCWVATAGSTGYNEGTITIKNNAEDNTLDQIEPQEAESHACIHTVPADQTTYLTFWSGSESSTKGCEIAFWVREFGGIWRYKFGTLTLDNLWCCEFALPYKFSEKTDVEVRALSTLGGAIVTASLLGWREDD